MGRRQNLSSDRTHVPQCAMGRFTWGLYKADITQVNHCARYLFNNRNNTKSFVSCNN